MGTILPFKIYTLQENLIQYKQNELFSLNDEREKVLGELYHKQEKLKNLKEQREDLDRIKQEYLFDLDCIMSMAHLELTFLELSYSGAQSQWIGMGISKNLESLRRAQSTLENVYGNKLSSFQVEKQSQEWTFHFVVSKEGMVIDEAFE